MANNKTIQTYSKIYNDYAGRNSLTKEIKALADKFLGLLNGKFILDVGCAHGRDSCYFTSKGFSIIGIDLTPEFITLASSNCPQAEFKLMDMTNLKFKPFTFEGVWACASFLHILKKNALKTLAGFHKVLKKEGILFLSVMEGDFEGFRKHEGLKWDNRYFSHYQTDELEKLLEAAGFKVIELIKTPTKWGPMFLNYYCKAN